MALFRAPGGRSLALLLLAAAVWPAFSGCRRRPLPARPNVLVITVHGLSTRLGSYGDAARTPHLDALAARGRRFARAYRPYPDAARSMASWWEGRRPGSNGPAVPLPQRLAAAGYQVVEPADVTAAASRLEQLRKGGAPFFMGLAIPAPPAGWIPPAELLDLYPVREARVAATADPRASAPHIALADFDQPVPAAAAPPAEDVRRRLWVAERATASYLDAQAGAVLAAVERLGLWDSTVVVLVGEPAAPAHGLRPDLLREDALRVPLIIAAPHVRRAGRAAEPPVQLLDIVPTLAALTGADAGGADGRSLLPLLESPGARWEAPAISAVARRADPLARSVRTERWRYTRWPDGSRELFDHQGDPHEQRNLAGIQGSAATIGELEALLAGNARSVGSAPAAGPPPSPAPAGARPNVLLITVDDLNTRLGCYGHDVQTPHLDRLAQKGRRFDRAYAQFPSCNPSRASFMAGWRPERTGVWSNLQPPRPLLAGAVPLQEHFRAHGYFTARVGKVYHGPFEDQFRWDVSEHTPYPEADDDEPAPDRGQGMASWWRPTSNSDAGEPDGRTVRRVAALLRQARGRPFFIAAGLHKPHLRWVAPQRYFDLYPAARVRWPQEPADDWADVPEIAIARRAPRHPGALLPARLEPEDLRAPAIAAYQACVSFMDAQVGVLLAALDELRLWERTIVVFTSDHGFHLGEHGGLWRKNTLFEESLRVPLLVAAPGMQRPGQPSARMVELVDVYPTLVDLAGLPRPAVLDGTSAAPLLRDPQAPFDPAAFSVTERVPPPLGHSLRTARWRYTLWPDGSQELYDHEDDPQETRNLAGDGAQAARLAELRAALVAALP